MRGKRSKSKSGAKSKSKAKSRLKSKVRARSKSKIASRLKSRTISRPRPRGSPTAMAPLAEAPSGIDQITRIAAASTIARYEWKKRGVACIGYIKGMALVYARAYCKLKAGDAAVTAMAKKKTNDPAKDVLAWYDDKFLAAGMRNDVDGADTLRHLFVLLTGLGMRESSGRYCEGRDMDANNKTGEKAEAGLFQTSYNARRAGPLLPPLYDHYKANPSGFVEIFRERIRPACSPAEFKNWGSGEGVEFQRLSKACPAFAAEFAALGLRHERKHWGPINNKAAEVRPECDAMLRQVQDAVDATPDLCMAVR